MDDSGRNKLGSYLEGYKYYCNNSTLNDYLNYEIEEIKEENKCKLISLKGTKVIWVIKKMSKTTADKYNAEYKVVKK